MSRLGVYFKEPTVSKEEHDASGAIETPEIIDVAIPEKSPFVVTLDSFEPLTPEQVAQHVQGQPHPENKLDLSIIRARIAGVEFVNTERAIQCIITMDNGYKTDGTAYVIDPANYVEDLGRHYAYEKAFAELIPIATFLWMDSMKPTVSNEEGSVEEVKIESEDDLNEDVPPVDGEAEVTASLEGFKGGLIGFLVGSVGWAPLVGATVHAAAKAKRLKLREDIQTIAKRIEKIQNGQVALVEKEGLKLPSKLKRVDYGEIIFSALMGQFFGGFYGIHQGSELEDLNAQLNKKLDELEKELEREGISAKQALVGDVKEVTTKETTTEQK